MIKALTRLLLAASALTSFQVYAEMDTAYIQEQVQQTIAGSAKNQSRYSDSEIADIVQKSNANTQHYRAEGNMINRNAQKALQSNQAKRNQSWATQNMQHIESSPEQKQNLKVAYETCKISERNSGVYLGCDK